MYCLEGLKCDKEDSIMFQVNFINLNKELMKFIKLLNELISSNIPDLIRMNERNNNGNNNYYRYFKY